MVKDNQVRRLFQLKDEEKSISIAAMKSGMSENTARKYIRSGKIPSQMSEWPIRNPQFLAN